MTRQTYFNRLEGLMADLIGRNRPARTAPVVPDVLPNRLPNRRALAVLDQMFGYYDMEERTEIADFSYDSAA